jgi:hypothetical protein
VAISAVLYSYTWMPYIIPPSDFLNTDVDTCSIKIILSCILFVRVTWSVVSSDKPSLDQNCFWTSVGETFSLVHIEVVRV